MIVSLFLELNYFKCLNQVSQFQPMLPSHCHEVKYFRFSIVCLCVYVHATGQIQHVMTNLVSLVLILPRQFLQNMSKHSIITVFQESYVYFMKFHLKFMPLNHNLDKISTPSSFCSSWFSSSKICQKWFIIRPSITSISMYRVILLA